MKTVIIFGDSHLAKRVGKLVIRRGFKLETVPINETNKRQDIGDLVQDKEQELISESTEMVYVLCDSDEQNLEIILTIMRIRKNIPITASLYNETIAPNLSDAHQNLTIYNQAKIATETFVDALAVEPLENDKKTTSKSPTTKKQKISTDPLFKSLAFVFLAILIVTTVYFKYALDLKWIDSTYFVVVTSATVGYGDIHLLNASTLTKIVGIALILSSTIFIWLLFSLRIDGILKRRTELALGHKKYALKDHIVVCGLGRLGVHIVQSLVEREQICVVIESNPNNTHIETVKALGVEVYIGNAQNHQVLESVGVQKAKSLTAVIANDFANIEIGLTAKSMNPDIVTVLRVYDDQMARQVTSELTVDKTFSMSAIADETFVQTLGI